MATTALESPKSEKRMEQEYILQEKLSPGTGVQADEAIPYSPPDEHSLKPVYDDTHRKLKSRHIQLIGIGGVVQVRYSLLLPCGKSLLFGPDVSFPNELVPAGRGSKVVSNGVR
ncbi:MAG: hypothetical protein Q9222_001060 [Ikaeria aurantiellina]